MDGNTIAQTLRNAGISLDAQTRATIDQAGTLTLNQRYTLYGEQRAEKIILDAQAAYELLVWLSDNHLSMLSSLAHARQTQEQQQDQTPNNPLLEYIHESRTSVQLPKWIQQQGSEDQV